MSIQKRSLIGNLTAAKKAITAALASASGVESRAKVSRGTIRPAAAVTAGRPGAALTAGRPGRFV